MAIDPIGATDTGLQARTKLNAAISQINIDGGSPYLPKAGGSMTGALTITVPDNFAPALQLVNSNGDEPGAGPILLIDRLPSGNPVGPYEGGYIYYRGKDTAGNTRVLVEVTSFMDDAALATLTSRLVIAVNHLGNLYQKVWSIGAGIFARRINGSDLPNPGAGKINALGYLVDTYEAVTTGKLYAQLADDGAAAGPLMELERVSASPAVNDSIGLVKFSGRDDAGNKHTYGEIQAVSTNVANGTEVGLLQFRTSVTGTLGNRFYMQQGLYAAGLSDPGVSKANFTAVNISNLQVIGSRKTGWSAATGTATRTTFDTETVTLVELARRVKALIDDLHSTAGHGLIGA